MTVFTRFEEIKAWQQGREIVRHIYQMTSTGAVSRDYAWCNQLRRAAMSIMADIAEGFGRHSDKDFAHFLDIARGSCLETQSFLYIGADLGYIEETEFRQLYAQIDETTSMIASLTAYLRKKLQTAASVPFEMTTSVTQLHAACASSPTLDSGPDSRHQTPDSRHQT